MTCRETDGCKNCPIKNECDEVDDFYEDGRYVDHEVLAKIYTKGREDAINDCNKSK